MSKKIIVIAISIISIILLALLTREICIYNNGKLDKETEISRKEMIQILEKGSNYKNYYYSPTQSPKANNENIKTEYYVKDGIVATYVDSRLIEWVDYNTGEIVSLIHNNEKDKFFISNNAKKIQNNQNGVDYSEIIDNKYNYKYLGKKNVNGDSIIYFELKNDNSIIQFSVNEKSGLILERNNFIKKYNLITTYITKSNENIKLDIVTDENIQKPNLDNY